MKRLILTVAIMMMLAVPAIAQETDPDAGVTAVEVMEPAAVVADEAPVVAAAPEKVEAPAAPEPPPVPAAVKPPETPEEAAQMMGQVLAGGGSWTVLAGLIIMVCIWVIRRRGWLGQLKKSVPWISFVVGGLATFASYLAAGYSIENAAVFAFLAGGQGIAYWEMAFKHVDKKIPAKKPPVPAPQ